MARQHPDSHRARARDGRLREPRAQLTADAGPELAAKQAETLAPELPVVDLKVYLGLEGWLPVLHRSDHSPFWRAKVPAMLWTDIAEFRNPNYHRPTDIPESLDYGFMRRVTQLVIATVARQVRTG